MKTFEVSYRLTLQEGEEIDEKIEGICLEQTVELPRGVLNPEIEENVVGKPVSTKQLNGRQYKVTIAWPLNDVGKDISQFLNLLYGNISLQQGIQVIGAEWEVLHPEVFQGSRFGISLIRERYDIPNRPLSATALKPLGSTADELAESAYQFAKGGIDIIKDDHGLADQEFAPFNERVKACVAAVQRAADENEDRSYYYPNITAFAPDTVDRYKMAADMGADGVLLCPHIAGLETMHRLARMDIDLPVIAHPAFSGSLITTANQGLAPDFLYGQLWRALGADFTIYPNKGGRFAFTTAECKSINETARRGKSPFKSCLPMPAGGMNIEDVAKWMTEYGNDTTFLIGGSLYEYPDGIQAASRQLQTILMQN